jgi:hypothetical protein
MIGAEPPALRAPRRAPGDVVLRVQQAGPGARKTSSASIWQDVQLQVRAGEVVGIAGCRATGKKNCCFALSGEDHARCAGFHACRWQGSAVGHQGPRRRRALGLHFVPEERLGRGAVPSMGLAHNLLLTRNEALGGGGWIRMGALQAQAQGMIDALWRQGRGAARAGAVALGRQPAEVHRGARGRRRSPAAHRLAADLGRGRGRGPADPRRNPGACAMRAAPCWCSARSWRSCSTSATACM